MDFGSKLVVWAARGTIRQVSGLHLGNAGQELSFTHAEMGGGMRMIFSMALAISAALAAGCATMKNDMVMNSMKHAVIVTGDAAATADCQKAREVEFYSGWGGLLMQEVGKRRVKAGMAELADQADANVVLVTKLEGGFWGANGNGIAFKCDENRLQNIRQAPGSDTFAPE